MRTRDFILASLAVLLTLVACEQQEDMGLPSISIDGDAVMAFDVAGGEQQLTLTATRDWNVEYDADWIMVSPEDGKSSQEAQTVVITAKANTGMDRSAEIKFTIGMAFKTLTVTQAGPGGSAEALIVYYNDYDKEEASKTFGSSGDRYPYLDQFDGWKNEKGTGAASVEYAYNGMSVRSNSTSDSNYSDYEGSGMNNMFFGSSAYLVTKNITLGNETGYTLTFGTEKYDGSNKEAKFDPSEFHVFLSNDGAKWVELDYEFAGTEAGRWNVASVDFSVPSGTTALFVSVKVDVASVYRMDDLKLVVTDGGKAVDFTTGVEMDFGATPGGNEGESSDATAIYSNNYDKAAATKTYGSGSSWPYLDQFDGWMNEAGTGAANVTYNYSGVTARSNSASDGSYSDYAGSGVNNIFFGENAYFATNNIALNGATGLTLTFGTEKYSQSNGSVFTNSEYHIWLSADGVRWVELTDYTFAGGTKEGTWNLATANFTVPAGTSKLSVCMQVDVASSYRMDDFKLVASDGGTAVDFTAGVEKDFTAGGSEQEPDSGEGENGKPVNLTKATIAEFLAASVSSDVWYELTGEIVNIEKQDYGNFTIKDSTGEVYIYGMTNGWVGKNDKSFATIGLKVGDTVTLGTLRGEYNNSPQGGGSTVPAYYISHVAGEGDDENDDSGNDDSAWTYTFASGDLGTDGSPKSSVILNDVEWKFEMKDASYLGFDSSNGRGLQMGKKADPASSISLSTEGISGIVNKIVVNTAGASGTDATLVVKVGGESFGTSVKTTTSATDYEFVGSASGKIELNWTLTTAAVYIKSITIYTE